MARADIESRVDIKNKSKNSGKKIFLASSVEQSYESRGNFGTSLKNFFFGFLISPPKFSPNYNNRSDFLFIPEFYSSKGYLKLENFSFFFAVFLFLAGGALFLNQLAGISFLVIVSGSISFFYFFLMAFKLFVVYKSLSFPFISFMSAQIQAIRDEELPLYTVLVPLYQEAPVMRQVIEAMEKLNYPTDKLDIMVTLEEYDEETIEAFRRLNPPSHFRPVILPNVNPKTKPKALNVAFLEAKGEFLVIYDAEILPDPDQLKKAYLAFRENQDIHCLQTRLDHYNTSQNYLTKLFNSEFSFYYDLFLPGLQKLKFPIPLSGHSTHFRTSVLKTVGAWDPYNVAEDCEIGMRLYRAGFRTGILDSISKEEATSTLGGWIKQRTRWMKGFMQTSVVHLRYPLIFWKEIGGWKNFLGFLLIVPSTFIVNLFNMIYWIVFLAWIITHSPVIQDFFPTPILYLSVLTFIGGNIVFTFLNLVGVYQRGRFNLVKYSVLSPVYWILLAIATTRALFQVVANPYTWEKTTHGLHLAKTQGSAEEA